MEEEAVRLKRQLPPNSKITSGGRGCRRGKRGGRCPRVRTGLLNIDFAAEAEVEAKSDSNRERRSGQPLLETKKT